MKYPPILGRDVQFPFPLSLSKDVNGSSVFGFSRNDMFIHDAYTSNCGRFEVKPDHHGLTDAQGKWLMDINRSIHYSALSGLDAALMAQQGSLGLDWKENLSQASARSLQSPFFESLSKMMADEMEHQLREAGVAFDWPVQSALKIKV